MAIAVPFYHGVIRKYVAVFGTLFNNIVIRRVDETSKQRIQSFVVPIAYGPWPKYLAMKVEDPHQEKKRLMSLPRMSFEIVDIAFDPERMVASADYNWKCSEDGVTKVMAGTPYNINMNLYIMVKYAEDAAKVAEQILPFFSPVWMSSVRMIKGMKPVNIATVLNSVSIDDAYEGDMTTRRVLVWTLSFTMKGYFFGPAYGPDHGNENGDPWDPIRDREKLIRYIDVSNYGSGDATPISRVTIQPGLTVDGEPTTNPDESIPWQDIDPTDDWAIISKIETGETS